ncbi:hypothetical protein Cgig2_016249 [Carnegiea gigantea]|uniref:Tr-type G domain-containing protein n=1 Tax=Carnegiea gigantea TaxID=171969 RepID=A0A9Q1QHI5_9CARY|nr:hypothetical protein Cgig2_016249 [Carnegiea gigantea]
MASAFLRNPNSKGLVPFCSQQIYLYSSKCRALSLPGYSSMAATISRNSKASFSLSSSLRSMATFTRTKPHVNMGTIGHVDHGKTTLTPAITKVLAEEGKAKAVSFDEIDKAPEEKKRGITIATSHVEYETAKRHYAITGYIDLQNMITGAAQRDGGILVIYITSWHPWWFGVKFKYFIFAYVGVPSLICFLNNVDAFDDPELFELVEMELCRDDHMVYGGLVPLFFLNKGECFEKLTLLQIIFIAGVIVFWPLMDVEQLWLVVLNKEPSELGKMWKWWSTENYCDWCGDVLEINGSRPVFIALNNTKPVWSKSLHGEATSLDSVVAKPGTCRTYKRFEVETYVLIKDEDGRHTAFFSNYRP